MLLPERLPDYRCLSGFFQMHNTEAHVYILLVPIAAPPHSLCHHIRKFCCIRKGISTSGFRPFQISISIVVTLQCQFNISHIQRIFYSCTFQTTFYFLHTTGNRILWIRDSIRLSGIFCIKLPSEHCIGSSPLPPDSCIIIALISSTYSPIPY